VIRESCAPVKVITDHAATRRVVDLTETDADKVRRGMELIEQGREILASVEREFEWRLDARRAACSLEEVCS
jgi:hypothetical protein